VSQQRDGAAASQDAPIGVPADNGWRTWTSGQCSIARCSERPVAAIERAPGPRRPAHWQPYCAAHARARGVEGADGTIVWTAEFLLPPNRDRATKPGIGADIDRGPSEILGG
jgi:hypothetical protein